MNTNELRDALSAGAGNIDARADAALAVDQAEENLRRRLSEAEGCLVRLREEANRRRYDKDDEALVKLLPLTDAAKRKAGLIPPKGGKRRDAERRRMHGALGDIERAPAWLLAAYYDEIMDLERIAKDARHALAAQGIEPHDEYGS